MISYDDFCKLPIFKKGYIAIDDDNSIWWYSEKPLYDKREGGWAYILTIAKRLDYFPIDVSTEGIKPEESLREVDGK